VVFRTILLRHRRNSGSSESIYPLTVNPFRVESLPNWFYFSNSIQKEIVVAIFKCEKCGHEKEGRCKPKKCPACTESGTFVKQA
jgi:hypothetical protein